MSDERHIWDQLISLMSQECNLLEEIAETVGRLRTSIHRREWPGLEESFKLMEKKTEFFSSLEQSREELTGRICGERDFNQIVSELEPEFRNSVNRIKSELKTRLLMVKSRTRGVVDYADSQGRLSREIMEVFYPSTRGRIYNQQGRSDSEKLNPVILSHHL